MEISLFSFVELYDRTLTTLAHLLDKGEAFATEQGLPPEDMLEWRLIEDMHPLRFQARVVINFARTWTARASGRDVPAEVGETPDLAELRAGIAESKRLLAALTPADFADRDAAPLTVRINDTLEPTLPAGQWLAVFATTNIYFHLSMAYAILRMKGVPIGKFDIFAGQL